MQRSSVVLLAALAGIGAAAAAEQPPQPPAAPAPQSDPVICRVLEPPTGSRLGARRICQKKSVWDQLAKDSQDALDKTQKASTLSRIPGN